MNTEVTQAVSNTSRVTIYRVYLVARNINHIDGHKPYSTHKQVYTRTNGLACKVQGLHKRGKQNRTLTLLRFNYTRRNAHTGNETFKKGVVVDSLALKYRHIFKSDQQKKFSAKRPAKNGQKKSNNQPNNRTAN